MSLISCDHCQQSYEQDIMIEDSSNGKTHYFCCNGCQGVYHLLNSDGMGSFYDKLGKNKIERPLALEEDSSQFDMDSFKQRYIKETSEGFSRVDLIIEGIHCAACVWLNEKILDETDGVVEATINFSNNKAKIIWDEDTISLSQIIDKIRSIGYNAYPYERTESEKQAVKKNRDYFLKMSIAIFASLNIMMIGVAKYTGFFTGMSASMLQMVHVAEFIFATPVLFYSGQIFFKGAYYGLRNKIINMDFLVITGATLTYIYSLFVLFGSQGHSYFDSVAMIITFVLVGKYLEVIGKKSATDTMDKIKAYIPLEATVIKDNVKEVVPIDTIIVGDIIEVKNGEKASVDGEVISGISSFDESSISGESIPVKKEIGDKVYSGTINLDGVIRYKATKNYANSTLNTIVELLEDALNSKPEIEQLTNNLSRYFSITILILALATFLGWQFSGGDFEKALIITISVIVIACPCALALATPIASLVGISWLSSRGLLFKEAKYIETFNKIDTVVFDKTGTLTNGKLNVTKATFTNKDEDNINLLYSLVDSSTHPVSIGIKNYLKDNFENLKHLDLENVNQIPAVGLEAQYKEKKLFGGKDESLQTTSFVFKINDEVLISFELEDSLKLYAKETITYLKENNIEVVMCSGDNQSVVKKIADEIGITNYYASMDPKEKAKYIQTLKNENKTVMMVGDGVNDTVALAHADIAIAMGNSADITLSVSDVVVMNNKLEGIIDSFIISKRTFKFIKQNLKISLLYNLLTIPLAIAGYVIPLIAALSMSLSSLLVVGNSSRIKKEELLKRGNNE
jgi:Cu+-exporting ATPase